MPKELSQIFQRRLDQAETRLSGVGEQQAAEPIRPGGWLRKEVLGHLHDSAANNHQRFVRATLDGQYEGPGYEQEGWVRLHGYAELPWTTLLSNWRDRNAVLVRIVERIPEQQLSAPCRIGDGAPVTLQFVIEDYLRHLEHHVGQITGEAGS
jgi:hypothetical protein